MTLIELTLTLCGALSVLTAARCSSSNCAKQRCVLCISADALILLPVLMRQHWDIYVAMRDWWISSIEPWGRIIFASICVASVALWFCITAALSYRAIFTKDKRRCRRPLVFPH